MMTECPVCNTPMIVSIPTVTDPLTLESFAILACPDCGLGLTDPAPENLEPYYPRAYYGNRHGQTSALCLRRRLGWLAQQGGTLLDVGCGDGSFLVASQGRGWTVAGIERFPDAARAKGLEIFEDAAHLGDRTFDRITLWHSLEHIARPQSLMTGLARHLSPGGMLIVAASDFGGWQSRFFGRHWLHLDVPRHLWHFTCGPLARLLSKAGLEAVATRHSEFEYDLLGWSQSMLNALFRKTPNDFFCFLTRKPMRSRGLARLFQIAIGLVLTGFSLPLVGISSLVRKGGTLVVMARETSA